MYLSRSSFISSRKDRLKKKELIEKQSGATKAGRAFLRWLAERNIRFLCRDLGNPGL